MTLPKLHNWPTKNWLVKIKGKWVSRQRAWQIRKTALGLCITCGKSKHHDSSFYCAKHHIIHRQYMRNRAGSRKSKPDSLIGRK